MTFLTRKAPLLFVLLAGLAACARQPTPATPLETLKTYVAAIKKKDTTTMKLLLSDATIKMHQQAAKNRASRSTKSFSAKLCFRPIRNRLILRTK